MDAFIALVTLTVMEIVLGIDNIIFISILSSRLPVHQQDKARKIGLSFAMGTRILLLLSLNWIMGLTSPIFELPFDLADKATREVSGRDLILFFGGLFLIYKSTVEIHHKLEGDLREEGSIAMKTITLTSVITQIILLDVVFSLDSVITAIGMANQLWVMIVAVILAILVMMFSVRSVSAFVEKHPTVKVLALSFLLLIGVSLLMESFDKGIPKGYIYFAMAFSVFVEMLNLKLLKRQSQRG
ncbi:putative tellurium resistance membrane protein TerC [Schleiferia thermophila]|uniref:Putative tellurium resistance membrane protein TerC n=2 Tax=Schleiferia thermophila TaxID=884107 RepID=A0A369A948_9FLAO|nr:putative tellurium resistance membrane protein TerC [Schleiferia thermophila]GCD78860.1 membrane protein [Schleiferia thermophila]